MKTLTGLRSRRQALGVSQAVAGSLIGKAQGHYGKIESGQVDLRARDALTLCRYFKITLEEIFDDETQTTGRPQGARRRD